MNDASSEEGTPTEREDASPARLWYRAEAAHLNDPEAARRLYHDLMVEHGHIVKAKPGQSRNLPCGWPHLPDPDASDSTRSEHPEVSL